MNSKNGSNHLSLEPIKLLGKKVKRFKNIIKPINIKPQKNLQKYQNQHYFKSKKYFKTKKLIPNKLSPIQKFQI